MVLQLVNSLCDLRHFLGELRVKIDFLHVRVQHFQRRDAGWRTANYASSEVVGVYVGIEAGGALGVGATAAHPRSMPSDTLVDAITQRVKPALDGVAIEEAWRTLGSIRGLPPRARLGVDLALHDLLGKLAGVGAEVLWGGPVRSRVKVLRVVGMKDPETLCEAIEPIYDAGVRGFKLKIGQGLGPDVESVCRVRERFGDDVTIAVDANAAYDLPGARQLCAELFDLKVYCVEQPLPYDDIKSMAALRKTSGVPLMADQLVHSAADAVRVAQAGGADLVSLKLTKMGSVAECQRVIDVCTSLGVGVHLGGSGVPGIVDSASTRLALARSDIESIAEVGESTSLVDDHAAGVVFDGPWATSDGRPGLGGADIVFDASTSR
jgi:L-alanine-DL-glutamate epimerase-like enolase superfamily enzyme